MSAPDIPPRRSIRFPSKCDISDPLAALAARRLLSVDGLGDDRNYRRIGEGRASGRPRAPRPWVRGAQRRPRAFGRADLTDLGQAFEALHGTDAVVHLAAIPGSDIAPSEVTFRTNLTSTYNVFTAATTLGLRRIVWASSETTLGMPFERHPPRYVPVDEEHPLVPDTSYALSKVLGEEMARHFSAWHDGLAIIGLRFSNVMEPRDYVQFPDWQDDPRIRSWNAWGYVDARDVAQACRLALEADVTGADTFIIAAGDTVMERPSRDLVSETFPDTEIRHLDGDRASLLAIEKARRILGYRPQFSWRDAENDADPRRRL